MSHSVFYVYLHISVYLVKCLLELVHKIIYSFLHVSFCFRKKWEKCVILKDFNREEKMSDNNRLFILLFHSTTDSDHKIQKVEIYISLIHILYKIVNAIVEHTTRGSQRMTFIGRSLAVRQNESRVEE
jgi:hypothetical protein